MLGPVHARLTSLLSIGVLALIVFTLPSSSRSVRSAVPVLEVHERRQVSPYGWIQGQELHKRTPIPIRIALNQRNLDKLETHLLEVSHPESPHYGEHWTAEQVLSMFAPSEETVSIVKEWLVSAGIANERIKMSDSRGWIAFTATVDEAERLLHTKYHAWIHKASGVVRPAVADGAAYSLPAHIRPFVDFVTPTVHFDTKIKRSDESGGYRKRDVAEHIRPGQPGSGFLPKLQELLPGQSIIDQLEDCYNNITPLCLRALYAIPELPAFLPTNTKNSFGIVEYSPQSYIGSDLDLFFSNYSKNQKQKRPTLVSIDGGKPNDTNRSVDVIAESNLDLMYGMALVNPIPVTLYQAGDPIESASFNDFLDALDGSYCSGDDPSQDSSYPDPAEGGYKGPKTCGGVKASSVISTSYGYNEADLTPAYEIRQCNEYAKLGLMGTTFLFSSGDYGVAGNEGQCIDPKTGQYNDGSNGKFNPSFPGGCPYVLSVGATQVDPNNTILAPESACQQVIYSGGGFSNVFSLPSYQSNAVKKWFAKYEPAQYTATQYNNSQNTRGYPDVSANGARYVVALNGTYKYHLYGTSASSPTFASVLTLINEARYNVGKGPVGFVNPAMYANPGMLTDIKNGTNQGCGTEGFSAVEGWDPVTGLGTPNYPRMLAYFLAQK